MHALNFNNPFEIFMVNGGTLKKNNFLPPNLVAKLQTNAVMTQKKGN